MQVAAKVRHRSERHLASKKAPISLKIKLWPHCVARLQCIPRVSPTSRARPRRMMSLVLPRTATHQNTIPLYVRSTEFSASQLQDLQRYCFGDKLHPSAWLADSRESRLYTRGGLWSRWLNLHLRLLSKNPFMQHGQTKWTAPISPFSPGLSVKLNLLDRSRPSDWIPNFRLSACRNCICLQVANSAWSACK